MQAHDWHHGDDGAFACRINGATSSHSGQAPAGSPHLWLAFNPEGCEREFTLPELSGDGGWTVALDSAQHWAVGHPVSHRIAVSAHAVLVLRHT